jgi:hypothetical protein
MNRRKEQATGMANRNKQEEAAQANYQGNHFHTGDAEGTIGCKQQHQK